MHMIEGNIAEIIFRNEENKREYTPEDIPNILNDVKKLEKEGRNHGLILAPNALNRYIDGKGKDFEVKDEFLLKFSSISRADKINQDRFIKHEKGIINEIQKMKSNNKRSFHIHFDKLVYAEMFFEKDLYYGSGGSTLSSYGSFSANRNKDTVIINGIVEVSWYDRYDWDKGKLTNAIDLGTFDDEKFAYLEKQGYAKSFNMKSNWSYNFSGNYNERLKKWGDVKWEKR